MNIPDTILRRALANVYFLWGRGKTTIAARLGEKYGFFVYSTDEAKERLWAHAVPEEQPHMCRNYEKEYGVKSFWELPKEVIAERERYVQREVTPMRITERIALAQKHEIVICEGDIDYAAVAPIASHAVHLHCCGMGFDYFARPDHDNLDEIHKRTDLTEEEKAAVIQNAYAAVGSGTTPLPDWVTALGIQNIPWDDTTGVERTAAEVAEYFGFPARRK